MKFSTVIDSNTVKNSFILKNKIQVFAFIILSVGIITGIMIYILLEEYFSKEIMDIFTRFSTDFTSKTSFEVFSGFLLSYFPYIILMFVFGTSTIGYLYASILSFVKAAGLGVIGAYIYSSFGLKGIEYSLLVFFPGKFLLLLSMLCFLNFSINNSLYLRKLAKGECRNENSGSLYNTKMLTAVIILVLSTGLETFLTLSFSSLFVF